MIYQVHGMGHIDIDVAHWAYTCLQVLIATYQMLSDTPTLLCKSTVTFQFHGFETSERGSVI